MFTRIHQKLGTAGLVVAVVALVAALGGGAYAASTGLNSKQKQEVKSIAKTEAKKFATAGPIGPAGPIGSAGSPGGPGKDGTNGKDGANGKNVILTGEPAGANCPETGGTKVEVEGNAAGKQFICNGQNGATGFTETLPSNKSLKGIWSVGAAEEAPVLVPISFAFPVSPGPTMIYVKASGESGWSSTPTGFVEHPISEEEIEASCPGSTADPEAEPGFVCVYNSDETQLEISVPKLFAGAGNPTEFGVSIPLLVVESGSIAGTWAVTAP